MLHVFEGKVECFVPWKQLKVNLRTFRCWCQRVVYKNGAPLNQHVDDENELMLRYQELQFHGTIDLKRDVDELVVHQDELNSKGASMCASVRACILANGAFNNAYQLSHAYPLCLSPFPC